MFDVQLPQEKLNRQALYCRQVLDPGLVVVYPPVPLLDERWSHELDEPAHRDHSLAGVVQQSGLTTQSSVDVDCSTAVPLQVTVVLRVSLCNA